jgi:tyrosyl-tRNA synthetase
MKNYLVYFLQENKLLVSRSEGRRLIAMGRVKYNGEIVKDIGAELEISPGDIIEVGKRRFVVPD